MSIIDHEYRVCQGQPSTTIIVPAFNEAEGLPVVLGDILRVVDGNYEVIVVDDGSDDGTSNAASGFPCSLIQHEVNKGKGEALKTGIANATGENIIWIDADGTYPVEVIPQIVEALRHYDMVVCSRVYGKENIPRFNRIGNWLFGTMIGTIYGFKPQDPCAGLYGVKRRHLENMNLSAQRFAIESEVSIKGSRMKLQMLEIPIHYGDRIGRAKLNGVKVGFEIMGMILGLLFWQQPDARTG
ncbi:MAG: glycosyltransferase family 2 protein [Chloroflexota bacterium]|nr:glycosyltransferase family 2 protein [Chloroflexota bacterium]